MKNEEFLCKSNAKKLASFAETQPKIDTIVSMKNLVGKDIMGASSEFGRKGKISWWVKFCLKCLWGMNICGNFTGLIVECKQK